MKDVEAILTEKHSVRIAEDNTRLKVAKINTEMPLNGNRLYRLMALVNRHNFNSIDIKRSGTGLLIQFSIK